MGEDSIEATNQYMTHLMCNYWEPTLSYARRLARKGEDAESLTQDAFLQTLIYLRNHPEERLEKPQHFLDKAVKNRYLNTIRGKLVQSTDSLEQLCARQSTEDDVPLIEFPARSLDQPENVATNDEKERETKRIIKKNIEMMDLDEHSKLESMMFILGGFSYEEIAYSHKAPVSVVKQRVRDCYNRLRGTDTLLLIQLEQLEH